MKKNNINHSERRVYVIAICLKATYSYSWLIQSLGVQNSKASKMFDSQPLGSVIYRYLITI